jgi:hypothetical protein
MLLDNVLILQLGETCVKLILEPLLKPSVRSPKLVSCREPAEKLAFQRREGSPNRLLKTETDSAMAE